MESTPNRRPLKSRSTAWAQGCARFLMRTGISPNGISSIGVLFAAVGAWCFLQTDASVMWWLAGAACVQLRLLCNLMDGLVAVEGGKSTPNGELFNEVPDRIEDSLFLVAAGYAIDLGWLGWCAALLAVGTAYVRQLGGALGLGQDFVGPMAKPHRMAVLTLGALLCAAGTGPRVMEVTLWVIVVGAASTAVRRVVRIHQRLSEQ